MIIQHNITALNSYNRLSGNNSLVSKNLEKLSSGFKINRAGDDAAGLAISEKMRAQITGLTRATQNSQDGISLVQTAEGNLTEVHSMLNRMVDLATQSSNGTYDNETDRKNLNKEVESLQKEIDRIADTSHFNGIKLLDGTMGGYSVGGNAANDIAGFVEGDTVTVMGGKLKGSDVMGVSFAAAGQWVLSNATKIGGKTITNGDFAGVGLKVTYTRNDVGVNSARIEIDDPTKVTKDLADAVGDGITFSFTTTAATTAATGTKTVTVSADGAGNAINGGLNLQIGDSADQRVTVSVGNMGTKALGINAGAIDISTEIGASKSLKIIKNAINTVSATRADLGAIQNRLEHTINNLTSTAENMTAAESRIRDTDMAKEMMAFTKNNVLSQAAQAMLAQANQQPQQVLQLLR